MKVWLLQVTIYQDDGWTRRTERFRNPHWDDIDMAIRHLDRFHYPFVWLFRNADVEEDALPEFNVMGGKGEYTMDSRMRQADRRPVIAAVMVVATCSQAVSSIMSCPPGIMRGVV
jgi:hypothetical protein